MSWRETGLIESEGVSAAERMSVWGGGSDSRRLGGEGQVRRGWRSSLLSVNVLQAFTPTSTRSSGPQRGGGGVVCGRRDGGVLFT